MKAPKPLTEREQPVNILAMIHKWGLMKQRLIKWLGKVELNCLYEENMNLV
jgi:hypothetical protein